MIGIGAAALHAVTFRVDVTPPLGAALCAGLVAPAREIADPLFAIGAILVTEEGPVLICAVDWCEIDNESHLAWRGELARALDVAADRVALHTVHQHNAPIADLAADRLVVGAGGMSPTLDVPSFQACVAATAEAARAARKRLRPVGRVALGSAVVKEVASARRILGADGKVLHTRWAATREPGLRAEPEGVIDPLLRTVTLLGDDPLVSFHFYATHPMSYYGDGVVTSDFAGLARERRCRETPGLEHIYLNGCGGDITPGKYNEGTPESRVRLTDRIHAALKESERHARPSAVGRVRWDSLDMTLPARVDLVPRALEELIADAGRKENDRKTAALRLAYLRRLTVPTCCSRLRIGDDADILFLPGEPFVEYQISAARQGRFVAVAGYGDTGPGYLPLARSYAEGGYEITASSVSEETEPILKGAMRRLLSA